MFNHGVLDVLGRGYAPNQFNNEVCEFIKLKKKASLLHYRKAGCIVAPPSDFLPASVQNNAKKAKSFVRQLPLIVSTQVQLDCTFLHVKTQHSVAGWVHLNDVIHIWKTNKQTNPRLRLDYSLFRVCVCVCVCFLQSGQNKSSVVRSFTAKGTLMA